MYYNLWIIKEYFSDMIAGSRLSDPNAKIGDFRLYDPNAKPDPSVLYMGTAENLLPDHPQDSRIVFMNRDDYLILDSADLTGTLNRMFAMHRYFSDWEDDCRRIISRGNSLNSLLDKGEEILKTPLLIIDSSQYLLTFSRGFPELSHNEGVRFMLEKKTLPITALKNFNRNFFSTFQEKQSFFIPKGTLPHASLCHNIFIREELTATLILICPQDDPGKDIEFLFEQFASFVQEWVEVNRTEDTENHFNSSFARLLDKNTDSLQVLEHGLSLRGWTPDCPKILITAASVSSQSHFDRFLSKTISEEYPGIYGIVFQKMVVFLCNLKLADEDVMKELEMRLQSHLYYGASCNTFRNLLQVPFALSQALKILQSKEPVSGKIYYFHENAVSYLTSLPESDSQVSAIHPLVSVLADYDRNYHTEYYKTLFCYLQNERNQQVTSRELFIHRNTLSLRLAKIQSLWHPDLENPEERFYLLYSFYNREFWSH